MRFFGVDSLERWLETELRQADGGSHRTVPPPRFASMEPSRRRSRVVRLVAGLGATQAALAASAAVALAAGGFITAKAVTTGDPNPFDPWGRTVTQQVQSCKSALAQGQHGIGACVSSTAPAHGQSVSGSNRQNGTPPAGPPSATPGGPPATLPAGPPAVLPPSATDRPTAPPSVTAPPAVPTPTPEVVPSHRTGPPSPHPTPHS